ncbi:MAG: SBBP repeat-containing protein [Candidatus Acidiferrum sp.]
MKLVGSDPHATVSGVDELSSKSNFFIGSDPKKWQTNLTNYAKVKYVGVYPGVDLIYYGNQDKLEYDFVVAPGADLRRIQFDLRGTKRIHLDKHGDLVLKMETGEDEIRWLRPVVYQKKNGTKQLVAAHYAITDGNRVGFEVAEYDASRTLYIDPVIYSTYLGGTGGDDSYAIAVDSSGNAYVTGETGSTDFPTTSGAFQTVCSDCSTGSAFVTKLNPTGSALVYSTYLGGSGGGSGNPGDSGSGIAVDSSGNAYVTGETASSNFPTTPGAFQTVCNGGSGCAQYVDGFVTKLNPTGSALVYSTYLGGNSYDVAQGIAVDSSGNAYITGFTQSTDFPTKNAVQPQYGGDLNAFVTKLNPTGSALVYSTYLGGSGGGSGQDYGYGIAVDSSGNAYVTGSTGSSNFPTTPGAFQTACNGCPTSHAFVTKYNLTGSALVYSTYLGGSTSDGAGGIAVDSSGNAYVTGFTSSTDFPTTPGAFQTVCNGGSGCAQYGDAFVTEFNPEGSALVYSTYLGGSNYEQNPGIAVDSSGNAYVTGTTGSTDFPTTPGAFQTTCNGCSGIVFVAKFGIGSTQGPAANVTPSTLGFGSLLIGTTSGSQPIVVSNAGSAALTISSIELSGTNESDFSQTNNCGASVAANASCTISVTLTPSAAGAQSASLIITDSASNSPQTVPLTGSGTDFSIVVANGGSSTATVTAGKPATYNLQVNPLSGFNGTANLTCSGAPAEATCTVSPSSATPNGAAVPFAVSVSTTASSIVIPQFRPDRWHGPKAAPLYLLLFLVTFLILMGFRNSTNGLRKRFAYVPALGALIALALVGGCSGTNTVHTQIAGTPAGTYNLTITGTSSGVTRTQSLTLTVQ